jgi:hypothetical protein
MCVCVCLGHTNTNVPLILKACDVILFAMGGKPHNGAFFGIFQGGLDLFVPKIALHYGQDNLGVKKAPAS